MKKLLLGLRATSILLLIVSALCGLTWKNFPFTVLGVAGIVVVGFWEYIGGRIVSFGPEGVKLGELMEIKNPSPDMSGDIRDNFILLGNTHLMTALMEGGTPEKRQDFAGLALVHYICAHNLKDSLLTSYRIMQCIAITGVDPSNEELLPWFDMCTWFVVDGPRDRLKGREDIAQWIRDRQGTRHSSGFAAQLRKDLRTSAGQSLLSD